MELHCRPCFEDLLTFPRQILTRFVTLLQKEGENASLEGVHLLNEENDCILGALIHATHRLYLLAEGEERSDLCRDLVGFFEMAATRPCGTWGKISLLSVLCELKADGALTLLPDTLLDVLREKTDIGDFYDKTLHVLIGKAANYYHVAAICAALRARLGWETEEMAKTVAAHLLAAVCTTGKEGFLDDQPPEGRFDSYTFMVAQALPDQCIEAGIPVPPYALTNLKRAAQAVLHMANEQGDGFVYGRSIGIYGDVAPLGLLLSAMKHGLLSEEEKAIAYSYILAILKKLWHFWYDEHRGCFNIWFDGRATDGYREVHRLLEVNLSLSEKILDVIDDLKKLSLWGTAPIPLPSPYKWEAHTVRFLNTESQKAAAILLRYQDTLAMLPCIGSGDLSSFSSYLPFPGIAGVLEAAPQSLAPYLVPEYVKDEEIFRPIQYYTEIKVTETAAGVRVDVSGNLAHPSRYPDRPTRTEYTFCTQYVFEGNFISARFETDLPYDCVRMHTAKASKPADIRAWGFTESTVLPLGTKDTVAPHGAYAEYYEHTARTHDRVGWEITLSC